jgi:hypothetical protein
VAKEIEEKEVSSGKTKGLRALSTGRRLKIDWQLDWLWMN